MLHSSCLWGFYWIVLDPAEWKEFASAQTVGFPSDRDVVPKGLELPMPWPEILTDYDRVKPLQPHLLWQEYSGEEAIGLARRALPLLNRRTPKMTIVSEAVADISQQGGVEQYLSHAAALKPKWVPFSQYPRPTLMAMEMALFQEEERRAMEGEIERLARAWEEAEELAEISDNLLLPEGTEEFLEEHRED